MVLKQKSIIKDREKAIEYGLRRLSRNDLLFILGKGAEQEQVYADRTLLFNDKDCVLELVRTKGY